MKKKWIENYKQKVQKFEKKHHIFTAMLVYAAMVLIWRGIWILGDILLFPETLLLSALSSILIGFIILYLRDFKLKELIK